MQSHRRMYYWFVSSIWYQALLGGWEVPNKIRDTIRECWIGPKSGGDWGDSTFGMWVCYLANLGWTSMFWMLTFWTKLDYSCDLQKSKGFSLPVLSWQILGFWDSLNTLYFGWVHIHSNTHTVTLAKSFLTKWALVAVVFWVADESDILLMAAVVLPPLPPGALQEVCLLPRADHIIQPDGPRASLWVALFFHSCTFPIPAQHTGIFGPQWSEDAWCLSMREWYSWGNRGFSSILSKQVQLALNSVRAPYAASSVMVFLRNYCYINTT